MGRAAPIKKETPGITGGLFILVIFASFFFFFCGFVRNDEPAIYFCDFLTIINTLLEEIGGGNMIVCAHGDVAGFCAAHEMEILECYIGYLEDYKGNCAVVVTDQRMSRSEYDSLKCTLFSRGVELVSTEWTDDEVILRLLWNQIEQRGKRGGRQLFGFAKRNGEIVGIPEKIAVARRIIEMRDEGRTLREIQAEAGMYYADGKPLAISTIQTIIKNRGKYEKKV